MGSKVYFADLRATAKESLINKLDRLLHTAGISDIKGMHTFSGDAYLLSHFGRGTFSFTVQRNSGRYGGVVRNSCVGDARPQGRQGVIPCGISRTDRSALCTTA